MNCADCRFSVVDSLDDGDVVLECHRFPPQIMTVADVPVHGWPSVSESTWCGEWQAPS